MAVALAIMSRCEAACCELKFGTIGVLDIDAQL